jgi:hypothetical protein
MHAVDTSSESLCVLVPQLLVKRQREEAELAAQARGKRE